MRKIVKTIFFMIIVLLLSYSSSYAAVIEIKDSTAQVLTNATISDFYVMAEGLKGTGQILEGTTVDVKMANNYEWAAVSYFSNSSYGTNGAGQNNGVNFNTGVKTRKSTNGNITGVMDWGNNYTYTAGIIDSYAEKTIATTGDLTGSNPSISKIVENAETGRVDKVGTEAINESRAQMFWYGATRSIDSSGSYPYSVRKGLFSLGCGRGYGNEPGSGYFLFRPDGAARTDVTFRSVFYAQ